MQYFGKCQLLFPDKGEILFDVLSEGAGQGSGSRVKGKLTQNGFKNLNIRPETIKCIEENIGKSFLILVLTMIFWI